MSDKIKSRLSIFLPPSSVNLATSMLNNDDWKQKCTISSSDLNKNRKHGVLYFQEDKNCFFISGFMRKDLSRIFCDLMDSVIFGSTVLQDGDYITVSFNSGLCGDEVMSGAIGINTKQKIFSLEFIKTKNLNGKDLMTFKVKEGSKMSDNTNNKSEDEAATESNISDFQKEKKKDSFKTMSYNIMMDTIDSFILFSNKAFFFYMVVFFSSAGDYKIPEDKLSFIKENQVSLFFMVMFSFVFGTIIGLLSGA